MVLWGQHSGMDHVSRGTPVSDQELPRIPSPDEIDLFKKYRDLALPAGRLASLDDFAKWLFTSITVIGSLAAAFSSSAIK